jgi:hypothetical protein
MLVAVAESLAIKFAESSERIENYLSIEMQDYSTGTFGTIRFGVYGCIGAKYYPDENQYMPEYGMEYLTYTYKFENGLWHSEDERIREAEQNAAENFESVIEDDLPF